MVYSPIPIGRRESSSNASGTAREIRCGPITDHRLVDEHFPAEIGAVTALAADACLDEMLAACDGVHQRCLLQINAGDWIGCRGATGDSFSAQRFEFRRT